MGNDDFRIDRRPHGDAIDVFHKDDRIAWFGTDDGYLHEAKTVWPIKASDHHWCDIPLFCWFQYWAPFFVREVRDVHTDDSQVGTGGLSITTASQDGAVACRTRVAVHFDPDLPGYVYDVTTTIDVVADGQSNHIAGNKGQIEFVNFHALGLASRKRKLWQRTVYDGSDGLAYAIPHNHVPSSDKYDILIPEAGRIAFLYEPQGNPTIQVRQSTQASVCWMWYDNHLCLPVEAPDATGRIPPGSTFQAAYRLFNCPEELSRALNDTAQPRPIPDGEKEPLVFPRFERGLNSFEHAVVPGDVEFRRVL